MIWGVKKGYRSGSRKDRVFVIREGLVGKYFHEYGLLLAETAKQQWLSKRNSQLYGSLIFSFFVAAQQRYLCSQYTNRINQSSD